MMMMVMEAELGCWPWAAAGLNMSKMMFAALDVLEAVELKLIKFSAVN